MAKSLVEMAAELVQAQCSSTSMTAEEVAQALQATYNALRGLQLDEAQGAAAAGGGAEPPISPEKSIQKHKIVCLECGQEFKMISPKHLKSHGLTGREYRKKWGLPLRQALCAKELSDRRKKAGKARGLPANLRKSIAERSGKGKVRRAPRAAAKKA
ncbi:MucR family transcriptional regulator [Desulfurivibrio sp. D14AmB]|uniref:MucR family transcriptional regulator n=1 Tax=Desulfurivibrio sp. D14AmB TaxID=3374370 RepID=UPI00376EA952